jgi:pimeloyl-ACP methyl ester carboxylesterase
MKRKLFTLDNIFISYLEHGEENQGTILFIHGNSNSANLWHNQFSNPDWKEYRIIALDLPGHGQSSALENYSLLSLCDIVAKWINEVCKQQSYLLCGLSLGGNIIAEILPSLNNRPKGICLVSSNPVGKNVRPDEVIADPLVQEVLFAENSSMLSISNYLKKSSLNFDTANQEFLLLDYLKVDSLFRVDFPASVAAGKFSDEISILKGFNIPLMAVFGSKDSVGVLELLERADFDLWRGEIQLVENAGHLVVLDKPDKFNSLLSDFIDDILNVSIAECESN